MNCSKWTIPSCTISNITEELSDHFSNNCYNVFRIFFGYVSDIFGIFFGYASDIFRIVVSYILRMFFGYFLSRFRKIFFQSKIFSIKMFSTIFFRPHISIQKITKITKIALRKLFDETWSSIQHQIWSIPKNVQGFVN